MNLHWPVFHWPQLNLSQVPMWVWPPFLGLFAAWFGWTSYQQYLKGEASLPRSSFTYYRDKQPILFWLATVLSFSYILMFAVGSVWFTEIAIQKHITGNCDPANTGTEAYYRSLAKNCNASSHSMWATPGTLQLLHDNRAFALQRVGDNAAAIDELTKAITIEPKDEWAFYTRGYSYERLGKLKNAVSDFDAAVKLKPDDSDALRERASLNLAVGQASKAIADLNRLVVKDATVFRLLSLAHAMKGECDVALSMADKALLLGDKSIWPYRAKGECFDKMGRLEDASAAYDSAIRQDPNDPRPYMDMAAINFRNENYDEAVEDLSRALKILPVNRTLLYQRCYFRALSDRQLEAALDDCERVLKFEPDSQVVMEAHALVLYRLKQFAAAEIDCTEILAKFPNSSTALYIRGLARNKLGNSLGSGDIASAQDKNLSDVSSLAEEGFKP